MLMIFSALADFVMCCYLRNIINTLKTRCTCPQEIPLFKGCIIHNKHFHFMLAKLIFYSIRSRAVINISSLSDSPSLSPPLSPTLTLSLSLSLYLFLFISRKNADCHIFPRDSCRLVEDRIVNVM